MRFANHWKAGREPLEGGEGEEFARRPEESRDSQVPDAGSVYADSAEEGTSDNGSEAICDVPAQRQDFEIVLRTAEPKVEGVGEGEKRERGSLRASIIEIN